MQTKKIRVCKKCNISPSGRFYNMCYSDSDYYSVWEIVINLETGDITNEKSISINNSYMEISSKVKNNTEIWLKE